MYLLKLYRIYTVIQSVHPYLTLNSKTYSVLNETTKMEQQNLSGIKHVSKIERQKSSKQKLLGGGVEVPFLNSSCGTACTNTIPIYFPFMAHPKVQKSF